MATLREEPSNDEGSTADEGVPDKGSGWLGSGPPMRVGVGYTARDICDGQDSRLLVAGRLLQDGTQRRRSGKP